MDAFWSKNFEFIFIHAANFTLKISFAQGVNAYCKGSKCMKIIAISTSPVLLMIGLFGYDTNNMYLKTITDYQISTCPASKTTGHTGDSTSGFVLPSLASTVKILHLFSYILFMH